MSRTDPRPILSGDGPEAAEGSDGGRITTTLAPDAGGPGEEDAADRKAKAEEEAPSRRRLVFCCDEEGDEAQAHEPPSQSLIVRNALSDMDYLILATRTRLASSPVTMSVCVSRRSWSGSGTGLVSSVSTSWTATTLTR